MGPIGTGDAGQVGHWATSQVLGPNYSNSFSLALRSDPNLMIELRIESNIESDIFDYLFKKKIKKKK